MENSNKIFKIKGLIKRYDWGGKTFLSQLLNIPNPAKEPFAEYWMGANLGEQFEKVPYLMKVLDVEKMLSIQVHPSREVARIKFREENEKGIPLSAPNRNYKDENHKPELLSPLSAFYLLHGFKSPAAMENILKELKALNFLTDAFKGSNYKGLYTRVMTMPQEEVNARLQPLLEEIVPRYKAGEYNKEQEDFWAARAALTFTAQGNIDRGIFSIYLFNVVKMHPGQALFQDAGLPHAYLEGQTMEIMANSDNVLRGGLTPKHIDDS
jgi:mannose-6-phosphate isomerase